MDLYIDEKDKELGRARLSQVGEGASARGGRERRGAAGGARGGWGARGALAPSPTWLSLARPSSLSFSSM